MSSIIQGIMESREREDQLAVAFKQARQITNGIKYDEPVNEIISKIQTLADQYGIDPKSLKWAINDVYEAKNTLESAVYGLDELFKDAYQDEKYKNDDEEEGITEEEFEEGYSAGASGGAGLGIEKSPMEKVLEKPLTVDEHINSPGGMGQSYRKFKPKSAGTKESAIMKGLQNEVKKNGASKGK